MTETLAELFYNSVDQYQKPDHLKVKRGPEWTSISSNEFKTAVEELAAGFESLGLITPMESELPVYSSEVKDTPSEIASRMRAGRLSSFMI